MRKLTLEQKASQAQAIRNAIQVAASRGKPVTGCGNAIANYLVANLEEYTPAEVRGWLKNLDGVMRELREELRAIES
jgi:hypothetical protein